MWRNWFRRAKVSDLLKSSNQHLSTTIHGKLTDSSDNDTNNENGNNVSLKVHYKLIDLVVFGLCNVIGSGIYVLPGTAGKDEAGSALLVSLLIGLFSAGVSALCYAEFASRIPVIGGSYTYLYVSSGEILAFLTGSSRLTVLVGSCTINAIGAVGYFRSFVQSMYSNDSDADELDESVFFGKDLLGEIISINILAPSLIFGFMCLVIYDIGLSSSFMNFAAVWNMLLLILFIFGGLMLFDIDVLTSPCNQEIVAAFDNEECPNDSDNSFFPFGFQGVIMASTITFWAFAGSENIASVAEEAVDPKKNVPLAITITLGICCVLYELITLALMGMVPFQALDESAPLSEAFAFHDEVLLQRISSFGAFTTMTILLFAKIISAPRVLYRISLDGLVPKMFSFVHPKSRSPSVAILTYGLIACVIAFFFNLGTILSVSATITLLEYTMVCVATLIMRYFHPNNDPKEEISNAINQFWTHWRIFMLIWSFFICTLVTAFIGFEYDWFVNDLGLDIAWIVIIVFLCGCVVIMFVCILYLHYTLPWKLWCGKEEYMAVPFTPYLQCLLIVINSCLMASQGAILLIQVAGIWIIALIIYFAYGFNHSKLNDESRKVLLEMK